MYTIFELQAADFLLKKLAYDNVLPFKEKQLKLVVCLSGNYWYGDFVDMNDGLPYQKFIDNDGETDYNRFHFSGSNAVNVFKKIYDVYATETRPREFYSNPFKTMELDMLFESVLKLVGLAKITNEDSPIRPYLLNARSLDGKLQLPFINMPFENIDVVSIIEIEEETK